MSEWQPIETAPRDGTVVLLYPRAHQHKWPISMALWRADKGAWHNYFKVNGASDGAFTHWMPLPESPQTK